jgi:hypothetical protein
MQSRKSSWVGDVFVMDTPPLVTLWTLLDHELGFADANTILAEIAVKGNNPF